MSLRRDYMSVFVNRILNLKKIKAIGFDMDYTIVRYHTENFEEYAYTQTLRLLHEKCDYPKEILNLKFQYDLVIQGLVVDRKRGNLLKLSRFGKVKTSKHGTKTIDFREQQKIYGNLNIDLAEDNFQSLDTHFSISNGVLYSQLVDLKSDGLSLPEFSQIAIDIKAMLDLIHSDGSLKLEIRRHPEKYVVKDPEVVILLEKLKEAGKKLLIITNSEFPYCKFLMNYAINPFLKQHDDWTKLFDIVITLSKKPAFFNKKANFLAIDPGTGLMTNWFEPVTSGIYQGGFATTLQDDLGLRGEEILYFGDHIYGDVVSLKKTCNWRTALVFEPLAEEIAGLIKGKSEQEAIDDLMLKKELLEKEINHLKRTERQEMANKPVQNKEKLEEIYDKVEKINIQISDLINNYNNYFNPNWGQMMRAGSEESNFAEQVEKYACIYMAKITDLLEHSTKSYFRPHRRTLPHERMF